MLWIILALIAATLTAAAALVQKKTLITEHAMEFSAVLALFNLILSIPFFIFIDYSKLEIVPIIIIFFITIPAAIAFLLISKSVRHMDVSSVSPLLVISPGITALLAFFFLGEKLTLFQSTGILLLLVGSYVVQLRHDHSFFEPLQNIIRSRYIHFIAIALLLYGTTSVFDRFILTNYSISPMTYIAFAHLFLALDFLFLMSIFHNGVFDIAKGIKKAGGWILVMSILTIGYRYAQVAAVKVAYVGLVVAIKRMSSFFATLIGGKIFHEKNLLRRSIACLIMIAGVLFIVL
jgi:drug/metabolite transporter (DMT)-like permease